MSKRTLKSYILCSKYISMIFLTIIRASIAFGLLLLTHLTEKHQKWTEEAKWQISSHFFLSWRRIHLSLLGSHLFGLVQNYLFLHSILEDHKQNLIQKRLLQQASDLLYFKVWVK